MDSQPWWQVERYNPEDDNDNEPETDTMSIPRYGTDRLPQEPTAFDSDDDLPTSRTTVAATTTQGETTERETATPTAEAETEKDATTYTSPIRIQSTTVELSSGRGTATFTTPSRASADSETSQTAAQLTEGGPSDHSTFATSTSASLPASSTNVSAGSLAPGISPSGAQSTALPDVSAASKHGMSSGEVVAAVIMPILAAVAIFALLFFCRRRRRRQDSPPPPFFPAMMEKMSHFRPRAASPSTIPEPPSPNRTAPVVTNASNNAYYTGLDTSSHGSSQRQSNSQEGYYAPRRSEGGTFTDPPPPYHDGKPPQLPAVDAVGAGGLAVPHLREPEPAVRTRSPFEDPVSPLEHQDQLAVAGGVLLSPIEPPRSAAISRTPSISSTQYSDTASVHSARAARMSVGGPQMIVSSSPPNMRRSSVEDEDEMVTPTAERHRSVFDDPSSPVSSIASTEFHTLPGSRRGSVVSDAAGGTGR